MMCCLQRQAPAWFTYNLQIWEAEPQKGVRDAPQEREQTPASGDTGCAGVGRTCECVPPFVVETVHSSQHLLLGAKGIQVPLSLGVSAVLSQTWEGSQAWLLGSHMGA